MYTGIDTAARITATQAAKLRENGVSFVVRYIGPESWGKTITASEAQILRGAGIAVMLCFESSANRMNGGARAGAEDAVTAWKSATRLGVPGDAVIYFACDYDAPQSDFASIEAYLRAAAQNIEQYRVGLYGGERVVSAMSERGACFYFWQCVAWSNQFLPVADVRQYAWQGDARAKAMAAATGILAVDLDSAETLAGMWLPPVQPQPEPWYADTVRWAMKEGVIAPADSIEATRPEDPATRAEVMQMIRNYNKRFEAADIKTASGLLAE
jgi:hypothetical protein